MIDRLSAEKKGADGSVLKTVKGKEALAEAILAIALDRGTNPAARLRAFDMLLDRAYGQPVQTVDLDASVSGQAVLESVKDGLDRLSPEERDRYLELCGKISGDA